MCHLKLLLGHLVALPECQTSNILPTGRVSDDPLKLICLQHRPSWSLNCSPGGFIAAPPHTHTHCFPNIWGFPDLFMAAFLFAVFFHFVFDICFQIRLKTSNFFVTTISTFHINQWTYFFAVPFSSGSWPLKTLWLNNVLPQTYPKLPPTLSTFHSDCELHAWHQQATNNKTSTLSLA